MLEKDGGAAGGSLGDSGVRVEGGEILWIRKAWVMKEMSL